MPSKLRDSNKKLKKEGGRLCPVTRRPAELPPEVDAKLWDELITVAKKNGQSQRPVLEQALEHYLHNVVPSQHLVRAKVMDASEKSTTQNRELPERLAKQKSVYITLLRCTRCSTC